MLFLQINKTFMGQSKLAIIDSDIKKIINNKFFNSLNNKSVLITGGSGLIGSYLLRTLILLKKKIKVDLTTIIKSKKEKFFDRLCEKQVKIIKTDLTKDFEKKIKFYDIIIHAAGYAQPKKFIQTPENTVLINTFVTLKLLKKLKKNGRFLFLSSSELYSGNTKINDEKNIGNINTDQPRSAYINSKILGETICSFFKKKGIKTYSARVSYAYGPGNKKNDKRVLYEFINQALINNRIIIKGGLKNIITYCYILDTIEILFKILLLGKKQIYNVAGISKLSILSLAKRIKKNLKEKNIKIIKKTKERSIARIFKKTNINLIKKEFKKKKFIKFDYGLAKTIEWQKIILNKQ